MKYVLPQLPTVGLLKNLIEWQIRCIYNALEIVWLIVIKNDENQIFVPSFEVEEADIKQTSSKPVE